MIHPVPTPRTWKCEVETLVDGEWKRLTYEVDMTEDGEPAEARVVDYNGNKA